MIHATLSAIFLLIIYRYMNLKAENKINIGIAFAFILVPSCIVFVLGMVLEYYDLPKTYALIAYVLYFIFPYLLLKTSLDYTSAAAFKYAIVVPIVAAITAIPFVMLMPGII